MIYTLTEILAILKIHRTTYYRHMKCNSKTSSILSKGKRKYYYSENEKNTIVQYLFEQKNIEQSCI